MSIGIKRFKEASFHTGTTVGLHMVGKLKITPVVPVTHNIRVSFVGEQDDKEPDER